MLNKSFMRTSAIGLALLGTGLACTPSSETPARQDAAVAVGEVNPSNWPKASSPFGVQPHIEARVSDIMSKMSLREKVGQVIQADIGSITVEELKTYPLGSVLNGGNSAPNGDNRSPAQDWVVLADKFYEASQEAYKDADHLEKLQRVKRA